MVTLELTDIGSRSEAGNLHRYDSLMIHFTNYNQDS
jgi:hypothetical protein